MNNLLCEDLVAPSGIAGGMEFEEEHLTDEEAAEAERRVIAAAEAMDDDGLKITYYLP